MLFTADLKSFSSYGLPSPSPSVTIATTSSSREITFAMPLTPPLTPSPSPTKRKRSRKVASQQIHIASVDDLALVVESEKPGAEAESLSLDGPTSLADRVKKRRRVTVTIDIAS